MIEPERTVLWSAESVQPNNTSIELTDSIDNYDELIYFGSGTRTYTPCVMTQYPVISGVLNLGGPFFFGNWGATDGFVLCNGTQVFLSGNSGFVASSYYWGKNSTTTAYAASLVNNRANDVRPYMIVGVKYPKNFDRTLIWSSDHTTQLYNTNISLNETVNHFDEIVVLGSGFENGGVGCRHASKNVYNSQDKVFGCDAWAYTPWKIQEKHNLLIGQEMRLSGNSGFIGSGYYMGMGNQTTAWAAGKWNADYQFSATAPYAIYGVKRRPTHKFKSIATPGGTVSASINPGYSGDIATVTAVPNGAEWKASALNITGATLTGDDFMYETTDVSAKAEFEHSRDLTLINSEHGTLSADAMSGFSGDVVTVDATTDEGWYFTGLNVTGATATGDQFMFVGENVTAEGLYTDQGFPITYESDEHVSITGDNIYIPGSTGITLQTGYDTYYRISGYEVTGGTVENGVLIPTGPCTARAVAKVNAFTATGGWEKGSNVTAKRSAATIPTKYALHVAHTGDIPASWYSTSNRWKPSNVSAYKIRLMPKMSFQGNGNNYGGSTATFTTLIGSTQNQNQTIEIKNSTSLTVRTYSKDFTASTQNVNYGISGWMSNKSNYYADKMTYIATATTGTWSATGYAP